MELWRRLLHGSQLAALIITVGLLGAFVFGLLSLGRRESKDEQRETLLSAAALN